MSLRNATLKSGATLAPTGGTDYIFADDFVAVPNGVHLIVPSVADYRVRPSLTAKCRVAVQLPSGSWKREKKSLVFAIPIIQANGLVDYNVWRVEREINPETAAAVVTDGNILSAQMLFDTDFAGFWGNGSLS